MQTTKGDEGMLGDEGVGGKQRHGVNEEGVYRYWGDEELGGGYWVKK